MMFYIRDIMCSRVAEAKTEISYKQIISKLPTKEEIVKFMVKRH